jgi:hypothetical protein
VSRPPKQLPPRLVAPGKCFDHRVVCVVLRQMGVAIRNHFDGCTGDKRQLHQIHPLPQHLRHPRVSQQVRIQIHPLANSRSRHRILDHLVHPVVCQRLVVPAAIAPERQEECACRLLDVTTCDEALQATNERTSGGGSGTSRVRPLLPGTRRCACRPAAGSMPHRALPPSRTGSLALVAAGRSLTAAPVASRAWPERSGQR